MPSQSIRVSKQCLVGIALLFWTLSTSISPRVWGRENAEQPSPSDGRKILNELAQISIDPQKTFTIRELNLDRDSLHITLHRGTLAFFTPVHRRVTGAVFVGDGEIVVIPPTKIEKFQLNKFSGSPVLTERFLSAVFRFTDQTFEEVSKAAEEENPLAPTDLRLERAWDDAVRSLSFNLNFRILQNLLGSSPHSFFHSSINGQTLGWFEAWKDDRAEEPILLGRVTHVAEINYADVWCSFRPVRTSEGASPSGRRLLQQYDLTSVDIDGQIAEDARLTATAQVKLVSLSAGDRLLPFELARGLKLASVEDGGHHPLDFFQNTLLEDAEVTQRGNDVVYVLLEHPTLDQEPLTLIFNYSGDVITDLGNGIYFVGERGTWYPNHGLSDMAKYHLKFHYPADKTLVATGYLVSESTSGATKTSEWDSGDNIGVAGFNYGDYLMKQQELNQTTVQVFANRGLEDVVRNLQQRLEQIWVARFLAQQQARSHLKTPLDLSAPAILPALDAHSMLTNIINDTLSALQFYESWFGPYPYKKLAISQIPGRFGQGWPSLCYVSTLTFLTREQQAALGMNQDNQLLFSQLLRAHEIAHQWWGNEVTANSYHDVWLMEGMASYAALLYAASKDTKEADFTDAMRRLKTRLLGKDKENETVEGAGPIWLGWRLYSSKTPAGYQSIVYDKGAWVIHMLRMLMRDPRAESDAPFISALKDFLNRHRGNNASTEDFKHVMEQHMTAGMDLDGNHKLDWFFDQWVYDVGIPEYEFGYFITGSPAKGYIVSGKVRQSGVPASFEMPVPIFAHYGNQVTRIGSVTVFGEETRFRIPLDGSKPKPSKISLNNDESVLCVVKSK
jgi:hypothetical protein